MGDFIMPSKNRLILQIAFVYIFVFLVGWLSNNFKTNIHDYWIIVFTCVFEVALICYITLKVDGAPLSSIGLRSISILDLWHGVVLGIVLYFLQTLPPILFMHMPVPQYAVPFEVSSFLSRLFFLTLTVGIAEEIIFRGYIFTKLNQLFSSKWSVILISCILFYTIHLPRTLTINGTHIYSTFVTTILFCYYLYSFSKKSIIPLIIAHGLYNTLTAGYGFIIWNLIFSML